jgi:hypothetical protein
MCETRIDRVAKKRTVELPTFNGEHAAPMPPALEGTGEWVTLGLSIKEAR